MADVSKDAQLITVHGREGLSIPYTRFTKSATGREAQVDISESTIWIEIPAARIRKQLVANPGDSKGLLILLTRTEVEKIPTKATDFAIIDETVPSIPDVEWEGKIQRTGYVGEPQP
jgi:hypothetical protein